MSANALISILIKIVIPQIVLQAVLKNCFKKLSSAVSQEGGINNECLFMCWLLLFTVYLLIANLLMINLLLVRPYNDSSYSLKQNYKR